MDGVRRDANSNGDQAQTQNGSKLAVQYRTIYSCGSVMGERANVFPKEKCFVFQAYGFPKAAKDLTPHERVHMPTQADINKLVSTCVDVPVTSDHGEWEVIHRRSGAIDRACRRAPRIVGRVVAAWIDDHERLVLECEIEPTLYGMTQAHMISSGHKRDVSLGLLTETNPTTGETLFTLDHVALVPQGRAQGTHITRASCPGMPHLEFSDREYGLDPKRYPLASRLQRIVAAKHAAKTQVSQTQKSSSDTITKTSKGISLYSASAQQLSIASPITEGLGAPQVTSCASNPLQFSNSCVSSSTAASVSANNNNNPCTSPIETRFSALALLLERMNSTSNATNASTPATMEVATPAVAENTTTTSTANSTAAPVTTSSVSPSTPAISSNELASAVAGALNPNESSSSSDAATGNVGGNILEHLLKNQDSIPAEERFMTLGEKYVEELAKMEELQQQVQQYKDALARFESKEDSESRQEAENHLNLLTKAVEESPNVAPDYINKETLQHYRDLLMKLPVNDRKIAMQVNNGIAAFGHNAIVKESFEHPLPSQQSNGASSQLQDELAHLRAQKEESEKRLYQMQMRERQTQLLARLSNRPTITSSPISGLTTSTRSPPVTSAPLTGSSALQRMLTDQRAVPGVAPGAVSNFGASTGVSQRFSDESFLPAIAAQTADPAVGTKRSVDANDENQRPSAKRANLCMGGGLGALSASLARQQAEYYSKRNPKRK